ncbi:suppressor of Mek1 [Lingula anatina]|uniref:Suppressor of Mek1 n=1 Tax=Lingula anatina TaxID=7574 RepID=A0A1S3H2Y4_LINAN|nr:suppressor of Mek1 [Lingula anatina]XP_013379832.1 suppressor of Mek1 [Lingula anatina]XP_013379841.1 suppressor of Mek1 [Lingula anatina]|eukprot:XP_013379824.1 suppressor of Mek1 [Lingula anatina]
MQLVMMAKERTIKHIKDIFRYNSNRETPQKTEGKQQGKSLKNDSSGIVLLKYVPPSSEMKENSHSNDAVDRNDNNNGQILSRDVSDDTKIPLRKSHTNKHIDATVTAANQNENFILKPAVHINELPMKEECKHGQLLHSDSRLDCDSCMHHTPHRRKSQHISVADAQDNTTVITQDDSEVFQSLDISAFMTSYRGREHKTNPLYDDNHELTSSGVETDDLDSTIYGFSSRGGAAAKLNYDIQSLNISGDFAYCSGNDCEEDFDSYADDEKSESSNEVEFEVSEVTLDFDEEESEDTLVLPEDKTLIYHEYGGEDFSVYLTEESMSYTGVAPPIITPKKNLKEDKERRASKASVGKTLRSKLRKVFTGHNNHGEKHHHLQTITYKETRIGHGENTSLQNAAISNQNTPTSQPVNSRGDNSNNNNNNNNNIMVLDTPLVNMPISHSLENDTHLPHTSVSFDDTCEAADALDRSDKIRGSGIWAKVRQSFRKKNFSKGKDKPDPVQAVSCEKLDDLQSKAGNMTTNPLRQYEFSDPEF